MRKTFQNLPRQVEPTIDAIEVVRQVRIEAAMYVRMSTENQKYSIDNQADAIGQYASARGFLIVKTYADEGKSGLRIERRKALKQLIKDVKNGSPGFQAILVYDVSRWGRFQDADESAYYEFICKESGVSVHYCAEQFENDGSLATTILKSMKRAMAGEYSRELSAKVFAGQSRLVRLGFRQGGIPGFGLRRQLISGDGLVKGILGRGEKKNLQSDRVTLIPGPEAEISIVKRIYDMYLNERMSEVAITNELNKMGVLASEGRNWTRQLVHEVLINEKYVGTNIYNRLSYKLSQRKVANPKHMWIRTENAYEGIIGSETFSAVQKMMAERNRVLSDTEMINGLQVLFKEKGALSARLIDQAKYLPYCSAYTARFGSLSRAYDYVGYTPSQDCTYVALRRTLRKRRCHVVDTMIESIRSHGASADTRDTTGVITINDEFTAWIVIVKCITNDANIPHWNLCLRDRPMADIIIALRMNITNDDILDYFLIPRISVTDHSIKLGSDKNRLSTAQQFDNLKTFYKLTERSHIGTIT